MFRFERRVENLVQTRVSLFTVNELSHLFHCEVGTTLSPPDETRREDRVSWGNIKREKWRKHGECFKARNGSKNRKKKLRLRDKVKPKGNDRGEEQYLKQERDVERERRVRQQRIKCCVE